MNKVDGSVEVTEDELGEVLNLLTELEVLEVFRYEFEFMNKLMKGCECAAKWKPRPATADAYALYWGSKNNVVNNKIKLEDERRFYTSKKQFVNNDFERKSVADDKVVRKNRIESYDDNLTSTSRGVENAERATTNHKRKRRETFRNNEDLLRLPSPGTNQAKRVTVFSRRNRREADKSGDIDTDEKDAAGEPDEAGKTEDEGGFSLDKINISPMYLIPKLIILGFSPVILANLKVMVMNALMLNNMALSSALFMTLKNMMFGATGGSKVKYPNYGYQNAHSRSGNHGNRRRYYVYGY
ncbi:hypothetical protein WDU94_013145 [Cyamophila willieti]